MRKYVRKAIATDLWDIIDRRRTRTGESIVSSSRNIAKILSKLETELGVDTSCPFEPKLNTKKRVMVFK